MYVYVCMYVYVYVYVLVYVYVIVYVYGWAPYLYVVHCLSVLRPAWEVYVIYVSYV
jgi:hypothetical protein